MKDKKEKLDALYDYIEEQKEKDFTISHDKVYTEIIFD